jgi:surfactin synthase thioesterase subunit
VHSSKWLVRMPGVGRHRSRLFCFPYAGGGAFTFSPWRAALDPSIELCALQLAGRGARLREPPTDCMDALLEELAPVLATFSDLPFAFFGHSLGGLVAFEVARSFARHGLPLPTHLFASACPAPQFRSPKNLHRLNDEAFIEALKHYQGTPPEILQDRSLLTLRLPVVRADFAMAENYSYRPGPRMDIPITVMIGREDEYQSSEQTTGWQKETTRSCGVVEFAGGHFFLHSAQQPLLEQVNATLRALNS